MKQETKCLHSGYVPKNGEPRQMPIYQSTTFKYDSSDAMGRLFDLEDSGYFYTRLQNPSNDMTAAKIADLEGGVAAMLTSSGQAANFFALFNICETGSHIVASSAIYGGTYNLLGVTMKKMGIDVTFVDQNLPEEELAKAFRPNTRAIVDSGNFDWLKYADKYPGLTTPDDSYHGIVYVEKFGKLGYITKATSQLMRDLGSIQSPQNAFYVMNGLESLHVRMERHCKNALEIARFLKANDKVAWVDYPDLEDDKYHALAEKYLPNGSCGVLSFAVKGGRDCAVKFMDSLKLCDIETHVADAKTCILHPASHTHRQMTDEQLVEAGIAPDLIRLSVGLENVDDLIADISQALDKI